MSRSTPGGAARVPISRILASRTTAPRKEAGIAATIAVQASPTVDETLWLLDHADRPCTGILGVVGWVDLAARDVNAQLDTVHRPRLVGIRPMIQDIPDDAWIVRPSTIRGLEVLAERGLTFDLLGYTRHLRHAVTALERVPDLTVVIDHLAKPDYTHLDRLWTQGMTELAARPHTFVKISGLATEVDGPPHAGLFAEHVAFALQTFGPDRCLIGSDWPVVTLAQSYAEVIVLLEELTS